MQQQKRDELQKHSHSRKHEGLRGGFRELWAIQRNVLLLFMLSIGYLVYSLRLPSFVEQLTPVGPGNLHVLIPASKTDVNLCKTMLSAAVLNYPSPVIINWNKTFEIDGLVEGGSHLAKIPGIYEYLTSLDDTHDDDLAILVDGYDIWFQLRPQTVVDRYYEINRRADERIRNDLGAAADKYNIRQEVVFGCQKRCWPWSLNDPPCYAVPQSSLPKDVYGPQTDTDIGDEKFPYLKYRQRFLNSGVAMGTVRALRKLFHQALVQLEHEGNFGSDQYIFSHIFGDQEVWREAIRRDHLSVPQQLRLKLQGLAPNKDFPENHIEEVRQKAAMRNDSNFEFGIGVDYGSEIGLNTVFAEDDTAWLRFDDENDVREALNKLGNEVPPDTLNGISPDIANSLPPFWTFTPEKDLPRWQSWSNVPLFTNVWTGITPAIIHHNAHIDGRKSLRKTWWPNTWFYDHSRILLDAHIYTPIIPIAFSGYENNTMHEFWPYEIWKGGARNGPAPIGTSGDENWVRFDDVCRPYHEDIFGDGKGPWELPANH